MMNVEETINTIIATTDDNIEKQMGINMINLIFAVTGTVSGIASMLMITGVVGN